MEGVSEGNIGSRALAKCLHIDAFKGESVSSLVQRTKLVGLANEIRNGDWPS